MADAARVGMPDYIIDRGRSQRPPRESKPSVALSQVLREPLLRSPHISSDSTWPVPSSMYHVNLSSACIEA